MASTPRLILAGLSGGSGKTIVSLGLCRALLQAGHAPRPFKKGPDYIDAAWLGLAARADCSNLDPFLLPAETLLSLFAGKAQGFDLALIEGNRGLFDGKDVAGSCSTAELARLLAAPVILVMDCTKMTRTAAAVVAGCRNFEAGLNLAGVVLNRTAGERHRRILREAIETYTDVPVLGMLPKVAENPIPERHMGLVSDQEHVDREAALEQLGRLAAGWLDLERILDVARMAPDLPVPATPLWPETPLSDGPVIGYVQDAALWFYYPENLEALERAGARLVRLSLLDSAPWPEIHGLYLGGGFPETQAEGLSANALIRNHVRALAAAGLPIYAECGGFMYLCRALEMHGRTYPLAGVFDLTTTLCPKPQGLGYVEALVERDNPFHPAGAVLRGHEFHYSACLATTAADSSAFALRMTRGQGLFQGRDGLVRNNVFAGYTHIHALGERHWAPRFVTAAQDYRRRPR
ncbi:MAG TPA: cobyrinate a,c-diamide synthase [Desulfovibrio sp.]|jgi:cobyrinic acid a,c-diamide synthase|uniref:cobyrinate a,c-diamide synthase n=1 Tax=Desulfovibrio TaxID=872 RepID=UPI002A4CD879|nr:cobyrinate a,c-diamide synthase [Desulfovibrio sp.]MDY0306289.1 cobyrinate a,c-diamide synthase [Desulfovibrionaceae bacterium]HMM39849.1 cobyrinate a,c-diamide synthase [Desulfovibrio sp.]